MQKIIEKSEVSGNILGIHISPKVKKTIASVGLSVGLLLGGNGGFQNEAQAGLLGVSPTPMNMLTSQFYSGLSVNMWNTDNGSKFCKPIKEIEKSSLNLLLNSNTGLQEEDIKRVNPIFIDFLAQAFQSKETIDGMIFFTKMIELGRSNKISEQQVSKIIKVYIRNGFIPKNVCIGSLRGVQKFYSQEEFLLRVNKIQVLLKTKPQPASEDIRSIFTEYFDTLEKKIQDNLN